jgi:ribosomal-protein-alanine N-acetyltransferase
MNTIRPATRADLPQILVINDELDYDKWSAEKFNDVFDYEIDIYVVTNEFDIICGYIVSLVCLDELRILNLMITQSMRKQGLAKQLLCHSINHAKKNSEVSYALLEIDVNNFVALKLYIDFGFRVLCVRKNYYTDKKLRDAYLMQLELLEYSHNFLATTP